jgi:predicted neutral ceramidase superfamily lipid hydrolase
MTETLIQPDSSIMPGEIRRVVGILWLSLLLALIATLIDWRHVSRYGVGFTVFIQIFSYSLWAILIWKIGQGRSWARITWLLLFAGGALISVLFTVYSGTYRAAVFGSSFSAVVFVVQTAIQFYAFVLLFTPKGRAWFLRNR